MSRTACLLATVVAASGLVIGLSACENGDQGAASPVATDATSAPARWQPLVQPSAGAQSGARDSSLSTAVTVADIVPARPSTDRVVSRVVRPDGVIVEDLRIGDGPVVLPGAIITFRHRAFLENGTCWEDSYLEAAPPKVNLGTALPGWKAGVPGVRAGGKRRVVVPPALAFGFQGRRPDAESDYIVPPNSTVIYEIEVLELEQRLGELLSPAPKPASGAPAPAGEEPDPASDTEVEMNK